MSTPTEAWLKEAEKAAEMACNVRRTGNTNRITGGPQYESNSLNDLERRPERMKYWLLGAQWQRERQYTMVPDESIWEELKRKEVEACRKTYGELRLVPAAHFEAGFDMAVKLIARPLLTRAKLAETSERITIEEVEQAEKERDSARAEAASLRAEITSYREFIANQAKYARRVSDAKACLEILAKLKAGRKEGLCAVCSGPSHDNGMCKNEYCRSNQ